jgi:uncharacterized OB-fold protein
MTHPAPLDDERWPDNGDSLGTIRCQRCGKVLTQPRKYDICADCWEQEVFDVERK